jgi:anti-sigma factor RsiW
MVLSTNRMPEPTTPCDDLVAFVDGELDSERAAAFRVHLRTCETCQSGLVEAVQLSARLSDLPRHKKT